MRLLGYLSGWLLIAVGRARGDGRERDAGHERGDVPGWVMVTVMTAILVVAILGIFEPQIKSALSGIIDSVSNSKK
ncbi:MAG: hypothetical protein M3Y06_09275 [Actinomycetota bacterium]|nr:hypothetical protein [Actinomycetota bacterium]